MSTTDQLAPIVRIHVRVLELWSLCRRGIHAVLRTRLYHLETRPLTEPLIPKEISLERATQPRRWHGWPRDVHL